MNPKFKILMTTDTSGGIWQYSMTLCQAILKRIDVEILLICLGAKHQKNEYSYIFDNDNIKIVYTDYPVDWKEFADINSKTFDVAKNDISKMIKDFNPDLVQFNHYLYGSIKTNKPQILVGHNDALIRLKTNKKNSINIEKLNFYKQVVKESFNNSDIIILPSKSAAIDLVRNYNFREKLAIINNGISFEKFEKEKNYAKLIIAGRLWDKSKNSQLLLKAVSRMPDNIEIIVAGEGFNPKFIPKNISYIGNVSQQRLKEAYQEASIYLALSSYESFGLTPVEAAYSNCAIVANDIPVYRELWGDCAQFFERDNVHSLIKTVNNLIENKNLLKHCSQKCQSKAISSYNSKKMACEYINLYKFLLSRNTLKVSV